MKNAEIASIFTALAERAGKARFVGGAVRDAFLGREPQEIDLAVNMPPERVMQALEQAGIKPVPTGLDHGTVTAVVNHKGYEITTLRRDVATDGRHAKIEYTDDWQADAARRDFTFNAFYADPDGTVYDYFGGHDDLMAGRVRFIGSAEERIREDVLRILRHFRFYAWLGRGEPDSEAITACKSLAHLLPQLSVERVWKEIGKTLLAADPTPACRLMIELKIMPFVLPESEGIRCLQKMVRIEKEQGIEPQSLRRLSALLKPGTAKDVAKRLRMSNREGGTLRDLALLPAELIGHTDEVPLRRILHAYGTDKTRDGLLLAAARDLPFDIQAALSIVDAWEASLFPITGSDLLRMGVSAGPRLGQILQAVETWWQERDFRPTREECLEETRRILLN